MVRGLIAVILFFSFMSTCEADELHVQSFTGKGELAFRALNDGTNYVYRTEWATSPSGPWSSFANASSSLDNIAVARGATVTNTVPMFYRVVASRGTYLMIDLSGGPSATGYPVSYYDSLADVPGGADNDLYKNGRLLMRLIPKGSFMMGSPTNELGRYEEELLHKVTLTKDFYIGVFEVTQRQWELVMGDRPSSYTNLACYAMRPVEAVSYYDIRERPGNNNDGTVNWPLTDNVNAASFMGILRSKTGMHLFDLPTEAQWEYACRAGTTTALNSGKNLVSTGNDPNLAEVGRYWYNGADNAMPYCDASGGTAIVGSYLPNAWGLYDMHGNVWEWCLDQSGDYPDVAVDPVGPVVLSYECRILRGERGDNAGASACRSAARFGAPPNARNMYGLTGFRVALTLP